MYCLYFVCFTYFLIATDVVRSHPDYLLSYDAEGWLKLYTSPATWEEAFVRCHDDGAVLASPLNKGLANALQLQMIQSCITGHLYLGTHDTNSKGDFFSIEGVPLSDIEIRCSPHSSGADGDCLTLTADGQAHYSSCKEPLPFVCYKKLDNKTINECGTFDDEYYLNHRTGSCYKVHNEKQSWTRAHSICAAEGGYLVILNDDVEAQFVKSMFPHHSEQAWERLHIGLRAWGKERVWTTIHGDRIEDVYNKWDVHQPDNHRGIQDRAALISNGKLDDLDATGDPQMFVCEKCPKSKRFERYYGHKH